MSEQLELSDFECSRNDTESANSNSPSDTNASSRSEDQDPPAWASDLMATVRANSEHIGQLLEDQDQRDAPDPDADEQSETSRGYY